MDLADRILTATLDRIETRLTAIAGAGRLNAMLSLADPALVLPSPSLALMEVDSPATLHLGEGHVFRSLDPIGRDGEAVLTPIGTQAPVHPWKVRGASWMAERDGGTRTKAIAPGGGLAGGIRILLERGEGTTAAAGTLTVAIEGGPGLFGALERAYVSWNGTPLLSGRPRGGGVCLGGDLPAVTGPLHHHVMALAEGLLEIELTRPTAVDRASSLEIHFEDPVPRSSSLRVRTNVIPVWNSVTRRYPHASDAEQAMSEARHSLVHPLDLGSLGSPWKAWDVIRLVGGRDEPLRKASSVRRGGQASGEYSLSYVPSPNGRRRSVLSIVLSPEARARLDQQGRGVAAEFRVTTGADGNGWVAGTPFELIDTSGLPLAGRVTGSLVGRSWGGRDGVCPESCDGDMASVQALLPVGQARSVADAARMLAETFGSELHLVDEWDLLRRDLDGTALPLTVRIRFLVPDRSSQERRPILLSCGRYLARYLGNQAAGGVRVVDIEPLHDAS
jgi:hypothetical protein